MEPSPRERKVDRISIPDGAFTARLRIRFSHCDPAGIVYFPRYFDMFNGVVEDWFTDHLKVDYKALLLDRRFGLPTVRAECTFRRPSRMGEIINLTPLIRKIGRSSIDLAMPGHVDGEFRLEGRLVLVSTHLDRGQAVNLPDDVRRALKDYVSDCEDRGTALDPTDPRAS